MSKTFTTILKSKKVPSQNVYLTAAELKRINNYKPKSEREAYVKALFMRECLTGARCVDCRRMSMANITDIDGQEHIVYVAQKHPVEVTVPVHKWLVRYLPKLPVRAEKHSLRPFKQNHTGYMPKMRHNKPGHNIQGRKVTHPAKVQVRGNTYGQTHVRNIAFAARMPARTDSHHDGTYIGQHA